MTYRIDYVCLVLFVSDGLSLFRVFLRSEFSEENLEFWIACEEYKKTKPPKLGPKSKRIFADFVAIQAPKEVKNNVPYRA